MARLSLTGAAWQALQVPDGPVRELCCAHGLHEVTARCLALRTEAALHGGWLKPSLDHLHDPLDMAGMPQALDRLRLAMARRERVRIITDYDVDGTTSSLILQAALALAAPRQGGATVDWHIPDRFAEGYGFSVQAAQHAAEAGTGLIVTADIGVRDHEAVRAARALGVDVLVCDHHLPDGGEVPPDALVLCPPQADCPYPNPALAACGISLKVAQALLADHPRAEELVRSLMKLAAVGTVADLVPLTTLENRAIVALGLEALNEGKHAPGLQALLEVCSLSPGAIGAQDLGFRVGPRINAAGRVADAGLVVRLLTCRDRQQAQALARELDALNRQRRELQARLIDEALAQVGETPDPFVVVAGPEDEGWHRGVVGIAAARLREAVNRPAAVVSVQGPVAVGSVRCPPGVHAVEALGSAADLLVRFGGHPRAAGFTVPTEHLDALRERLCRHVTERVGATPPPPVLEVDAEVSAESLDDRLHHELAALGPFGMGNPQPRLLVRGVQPRRVEVRGRSGRLLRFLLPRAERGALEGIWWGQAEHAQALSSGPVDLLGHLTVNHWQGRRRLRFELQDARVAEPEPP